MGERQLAVLLHRGEAEVLAAEEEQGVEKDDGGVSPQLLAVPQELFLHARIDGPCWEEEGETRVRISEGSVAGRAALRRRRQLTFNRGRGVKSFQHRGELV